MDAASIAKAMYETRDDEGMFNFWWHSHVNMGVFWSGTDMDTIRQIGSQGFVVATVFNKKNEMLDAKKWGKARSILMSICKKISQLKLSDTVKTVDLKQIYIQSFNKEYGSYVEKGAHNDITTPN